MFNIKVRKSTMTKAAADLAVHSICLLILQVMMPTIDILGYTFEQGRFRIPNKSLEAIQALKRPKNKNGILSYCMKLSFYRRTMYGFAEKCLPLTNLTRSGEKFIWTKECEEACETLKKLAKESFKLAPPDPSKEYMLASDASEHTCKNKLFLVLGQKYNSVQKTLFCKLV